MREREASDSLLSKRVSPGAAVNRSMSVESRLSAFVSVCNGILAELKTYSFSEDDLFAVHLVLDEAFENAVVHGNKMNPAKKVIVEYSVDSDKIAVSITDEGDGFEPDSVPDPRYGSGLEETSGRGLLLMNSYMDTVKFNEPGNSVYMSRYRGRPDVTKSHGETECP